jgi:hypothetical protein
MTRRKFFEAMGWTAIGLGVAAAGANEASSKLTSVNPLLWVLSSASGYDAPQSPVKWTEWLERKVTTDIRANQIANNVAESILKNRPQNMADLYRRVDEMDLSDLPQPHNLAHLAIAYLGWFGPRDVQNSFPNLVPGTRGGTQSDGGIHSTGNAALANELARETHGNLWGRLNFNNFVVGVDLMDGIIGQRNLALVEQKFLSGEYGPKVRLRIEGLHGRDARAAKTVVQMGRAFEAITTQFPGEREMTEQELIDFYSHHWYLDRLTNDGRGVDGFFDRVMTTKPDLKINSGVLDGEVLDDIIADMVGGLEGVITAGFDRQGIRGKTGTAFHLVQRPFDDWAEKAGHYKRYPLPDQIDAIVARGSQIGWREGSKVYFS